LCGCWSRSWSLRACRWCCPSCLPLSTCPRQSIQCGPRQFIYSFFVLSFFFPPQVPHPTPHSPAFCSLPRAARAQGEDQGRQGGRLRPAALRRHQVREKKKKKQEKKSSCPDVLFFFFFFCFNQIAMGTTRSSGTEWERNIRRNRKSK
jgi:hypothetical protein